MALSTGALFRVLFLIASFGGMCSPKRIGTTCIKYETYTISDYKMTPFDFEKDDWFSHIHFSPRRKTRIGFRSRRIFGCCDPGYEYQGYPNFSCKPVCNNACLNGSYCAMPGQCKCNEGYWYSSYAGCLKVKQTTMATTEMTTAVQIPCDGSCSTNEECSATDFGVCVCRSGFERSKGSSNSSCVPKCETNCATTVRAIVQLPCNGSCGTNEKCSEKDGVCECIDGYERTNSTCVQKCETNCTTTVRAIVKLSCNGSCGTNEKCSEKDGVCVCMDGYERTNSTCVEKCETNCTTTVRAIVQLPCYGSCGTNEVCADSGCVCKNGYSRSNSTCEPKCETPCQNANCIAPNTCDCWPNYERKNDSSCHLPCSEQSCVYGQCDQSGVCVCADGFLNNSTACVWGGDAILTQPDDCDCWSKFVWQKNTTEISAHQCIALCDGDDSMEVTSSECINFKECQCYEGFLVCHAQMYKCFEEEDEEEMTSVIATSTIVYHVETMTQEKNSSTKMVVLIAAFLATIALVGVALLIWKKRHTWCNRYSHMGSGQERLL